MAGAGATDGAGATAGIGAAAGVGAGATSGAGSTDGEVSDTAAGLITDAGTGVALGLSDGLEGAGPGSAGLGAATAAGVLAAAGAGVEREGAAGSGLAAHPVTTAASVIHANRFISVLHAKVSGPQSSFSQHASDTMSASFGSPKELL